MESVISLLSDPFFLYSVEKQKIPCLIPDAALRIQGKTELPLKLFHEHVGKRL